MYGVDFPVGVFQRNNLIVSVQGVARKEHGLLVGQQVRRNLVVMVMMRSSVGVMFVMVVMVVEVVVGTGVYPVVVAVGGAVAARLVDLDLLKVLVQKLKRNKTIVLTRNPSGW